jgi:hypothetical protein
VWEQAKKENPKPQLILPVPFVGFKGNLKEYIVCLLNIIGYNSIT